MATTATKSKRLPWAWIPSLYYVEGLPYIFVMEVTGIMYKNLGVSNTELAFFTSLLYLPWVIKPLWSPFVDVFLTKRRWITIMQVLLAVGFATVAFAIPADNFLLLTILAFYIVAFSSATHDIAADGFYLVALRDDQQAFYVGIRSLFYRLAMMSGTGLFIVAAGFLEESLGDVAQAWRWLFLILAGIIGLFAIYHQIILPKPEGDRPATAESKASVWQTLVDSFVAFFRKKDIAVILAFLLLYRFGESQLLKLAGPFLLDTREAGGLEISTVVLGLINTIGLLGLVAGGILGGIAISLKGFRYWLWWMVAAINLPNLAYLILALVQPEIPAEYYLTSPSFYWVSSAIMLEKFGYGFGFTAFMMYTIWVAQGNYKTAHYAFATGFMALGMMIPGLISGWIQEQLGSYSNFFIWVLIATLPSFFVASLINVDSEFGKKKK